MPPPIPQPINSVNCPDVVYRDPVSISVPVSEIQCFLCKTNPILEMPKTALTPCPQTTNHNSRATNHDKKRTQNKPKQSQFQPKNKAPNPKTNPIQSQFITAKTGLIPLGQSGQFSIEVRDYDH
jgi:hypothetical protein